MTERKVCNQVGGKNLSYFYYQILFHELLYRIEESDA